MTVESNIIKYPHKNWNCMDGDGIDATDDAQ